MAKLEYDQIIQDLQNKIYYPIYVLAGEEPYFIDSITNYIEENILDAMEKEFNQTIVYGLDTNVGNLISLARSYPMSANHQVLIVKEAQHLKDLAELELYLDQPLKSTILVLAYKNKKLDKRTKLYKMLVKNGIYYESKKLYDNKVPQWIETQIKKQGYKIHARESALLGEYLGTDLSKIINEFEKLTITLKKGDLITPEVIEQNIGISKDYNIFALTDALSERDILRANKIIQYFISDEKNHSLFNIIPMLHTFFYKSLVYIQLKDKSRNSVASHLGINPNLVFRYEMGSRNYLPMKIAAIIGYFHEAGMKAKGVGATGSLTNAEILRELIFKILH